MNTKKKNKGGRPPKVIDKEKFEKYCGLTDKKVWISEALGVDDETLKNWVLKEYKMSFSQVLRQKKRVEDFELLENQKELSKNNPAMAIWLGKQRLEQSEKASDKNDMGLLPNLMGVLERVANRNTK